MARRPSWERCYLLHGRGYGVNGHIHSRRFWYACGSDCFFLSTIASWVYTAILPTINPALLRTIHPQNS